MFILALKKMNGGHARTVFTCAGICLSTVLLIIAVYYLYVGRAVVEESFHQANAEERMIFKEVSIGGASYQDVGDSTFKIIKPINKSILSNILAYEGVESIQVLYELDDQFTITINESIQFSTERLKGRDPAYTPFSKALLDVLKAADADFEPMISGRQDDENAEYTAMISETTLYSLQMEPEDIIGKTILLTGGGIQYEVKITGAYAHELTGYYREDIHAVDFYRNKNSLVAFDMLFTKNLLEDIQMHQTGERLYPEFVMVSVYDTAVIDGFVSFMLDSYDLRGISQYQLYYEEFEQQSANDKLFLFFGLFLLAISMMLITNTMIMNMSEQKQFIYMLKIIGARKAKMKALFVYQSLIYGIFGAGSGGLIGILISLSIGMGILNRYSDMVQYKKIFMLPPQYFACILGSILLICILTGILVSTVFKSKQEYYYAE